jgi:hypothetical protein
VSDIGLPEFHVRDGGTRPGLYLTRTFLNSFVMNLISFPMYGKVAHFVFSLLMSCTFCVL